jgi:hypothetical protein
MASVSDVRVGNCSGFYGDRLSAMREMLEGGPLDYLTGDYLAELTMLILGKDRIKDPTTGYAKTFLRQLAGCLRLARQRGVRIVANAGGLNPAGLAARIRDLDPGVRVAHVEGDDLLASAASLGWEGALTANAYLGAFGIAEALRGGAEVVVTGRVTDASLTLGPAIASFGWRRDDYDRLAAGVVTGHILECGAQATGGNFAGFTGIDRTRPLGFPLAEIASDGTAIITKHPGTGGAVTVDTVTAQLVYEVDGPRYLNPDVTARLDTVRLAQAGPDRVSVTGVRGEPPPPTTKVALNHLGGYRNTVEFVLTGLDIDEKATWLRDQLTARLDAARAADAARSADAARTSDGVRPADAARSADGVRDAGGARQDPAAGGRRGPAEVTWELVRTDRADPVTEAEAAALLRCHVKDADPAVAGRAFSGAAVELALASYPGFHVTAPPGEATAFGVYRAAYLPQAEVPHVAVLPDGSRVPIPPPPGAHHPTNPINPAYVERGETARAVDKSDLDAAADLRSPSARPVGKSDESVLSAGVGASGGEPAPGSGSSPATGWPASSAGTRRVALGRVVFARSGDKGGSANVGVWVPAGHPRREAAFEWLMGWLDAGAVRRLLPETGGLPVAVHPLPNLAAVNIVVDGLLGEGVAASTRFDPQAKAVGEWLRARHADVPEELIPAEQVKEGA